jgi:hypothetical protein
MSPASATAGSAASRHALDKPPAVNYEADRLLVMIMLFTIMDA